MNKIDIHWHPFSIASSPACAYLEFYIEVFDDSEAWTKKLWELVEDDNANLTFEVMGPYGTSLAKTEDYSHVLAIGTGTGIVPVLSMFKQHVRQMQRFDPLTYLMAKEEQDARNLALELAHNQERGSLATRISKSCRETSEGIDKATDHHVSTLEVPLSNRQANEIVELQDTLRLRSLAKSIRSVKRTTKHLKKKVRKVTRGVYLTVILSLLPMFGVSIVSLNISWNTLPIQLYDG